MAVDRVKIDDISASILIDHARNSLAFTGGFQQSLFEQLRVCLAQLQCRYKHFGLVSAPWMESV